MAPTKLETAEGVALLAVEMNGQVNAAVVAPLLAELAALRARVRELEAERGGSTQWGACRIGHPEGAIPFRDEAGARAYVGGRKRSHRLAQRDVYAPGPWRVAT